MLIWLENKLNQFKVPQLRVYGVETISSNCVTVIREIGDVFGGCLVVVRSSAAEEDGTRASCAGEYDTVLNVLSTDSEPVSAAIATVIASYVCKGLRTRQDEVIVQEMVLNTSMSGVVFTHDLNTGAPYYVINYDDVSELTNTVTSGGGEYANRTLYIHRVAT